MVRAAIVVLALLAVTCGDASGAASSGDPLASCLAAHGLAAAAVAGSPADGARPILVTRSFRGCAAPAPAGAAADGYWEISATTYAWDGHPEVTGASAPERIATRCARIELDYVFQKQGPPSDVPPLQLAAGTIAKVNGAPWTGEPLPFTVDPADVVVVHNLSYTLSRARCVA